MGGQALVDRLAARVAEHLVFGLGQRGGHAVGALSRESGVAR